VSGPTRLRQFFLNLALLAVSILLCAGLFEIALRAIFARSLDFSMEMWKYAVALKRPVSDPLLSFTHVPNASAFLMGAEVSTNSAGLRDREYARQKPPGVYRIVALGDSTMLGWGVPQEQTTAKILERRLNATATRWRFEVLNAGVGNYDTVQEVEHYLTCDRAFHPDLVILQYFINDAEPVPRKRGGGLLGHSYLAAFASARFDAALRLAGLRPQWREYYRALYRDGLPAYEATKDGLRRLAEVTRRDGARLIVGILPELHEIEGAYPFQNEHQKVKRFLAAQQVPVIDLIDGLRGHGPAGALWVTPADPHPNGKANLLIAAQYLPVILRGLP
jgi:hypothetical protein